MSSCVGEQRTVSRNRIETLCGVERHSSKQSYKEVDKLYKICSSLLSSSDSSGDDRLLGEVSALNRDLLRLSHEQM